MRPYLLAENNWKAIREQHVELAILPWGATEAHNYHLPYGTDNIEADAIAEEAGRLAWESGAKIIILPTIPFGVNTGQPDIKLDMNLNPSTQLAIIKDITDVLNKHGIKKLLIMNSHGGNDFKTILREIGWFYPHMFFASCNWFKMFNYKDFFDHEEDHAGEAETSLLLYLRPELVLPLSEAGEGKERKSRIKGIREGWAWSERKWSMVTADTGVGNPKAATREKGEKFFKAVVQKMAELFVEIAALDIHDRYEN